MVSNNNKGVRCALSFPTVPEISEAINHALDLKLLNFNKN